VAENDKITTTTQVGDALMEQILKILAAMAIAQEI